jgi:hypothetical protein
MTIYRGVFPVAPTVFDERGELDLDGQKRCTDFMIDAGSHGICILANWSEQFVLTDEERERVMHRPDEGSARPCRADRRAHRADRDWIDSRRVVSAAGLATC